MWENQKMLVEKGLAEDIAKKEQQKHIIKMSGQEKLLWCWKQRE